MPGPAHRDSGWPGAGRAGFQESGSSWAILRGGRGGKDCFLGYRRLAGQLPVSASSLRIPTVPAPWPPLSQGFVNALHSASLTPPPCGRASPLHLGSCTSTRGQTRPGEGRGHGSRTRWLHFCGQQQTWWAGKGGNAWWPLRRSLIPGNHGTGRAQDRRGLLETPDSCADPVAASLGLPEPSNRAATKRPLLQWSLCPSLPPRGSGLMLLSSTEEMAS